MGKHDAAPIALEDLVAEGKIRVVGGSRSPEFPPKPESPIRFRTDGNATGYFKTLDEAFGHARKNMLVTGKVSGGEVTEMLTGRYWTLARTEN
jgi:hypothetical protein